MTPSAFDEMIDNLASDALDALPQTVVSRWSTEQRCEFMVEVADALAPLFRDAINLSL